MLMLLISISFMMSVLFTQLVNPLSMALLMLIQTIIISTITGALSYSYWLSYILFMIFVGGVMVLFIYISSLSSNQKFKFSVSYMNLFIFSIFILFLTMIIDPMMTSFMSLLPTSSITSTLSIMKINMWLYSIPIMYLTLFIILYLLLALIVVVKIINMFKSPLRLLN